MSPWKCTSTIESAEEFNEAGQPLVGGIEVSVVSGTRYLSDPSGWEQFLHLSDLVVRNPSLPSDDQRWAGHPTPFVPI